MSPKVYNVGIIGYGLSTKIFQIPFINSIPTLQLHSIVQRSPTPTNDASKDHPGIKLYRQTSELFGDPDIHIIVIATTPETHYQFTKQSLESGKHVMVEKPFVPCSTQAQELYNISRKTGYLICVYQNRRWDSDFLTFRKLQKENTLGKIIEFETHFDRYSAGGFRGWKGELRMKEGGGIVFDLGVHLLDQVVVAFGMPRSVVGFFVNQRQGDDGDREGNPDAFTIVLRYPGDLIVTAKATTLSAMKIQPRYIIKGTQGSYVKTHLDCQEDQLKEGILPSDERYGIEEDSKSGVLTTVGKDGSLEEKKLKNVEPETYKAIWEGFVKAVEARDEKLLPVREEEVVGVLKIIEAAWESDRERKSAVLGT